MRPPALTDCAVVRLVGNSWKGREGFGKYAVEHFTSQPSQNGEKSPEKATNIDLFSATKTTDRAHSTVAAKAPDDFCAVCGSEGLDGGLYDRRVDGGWIAVCADCLPGGEWKACPPEPDDSSEPYRHLEPKAPRPWRVSAAGSPISANAYHRAVVSDAPNGGLPDIPFAAVWANGDWQKTEARNLAKCEKDSGQVSAQPVEKSAPPQNVTENVRRCANAALTIPDDLSIPDFLRRSPPQEELRKAA